MLPYTGFTPPFDLKFESKPDIRMNKLKNTELNWISEYEKLYNKLETIIQIVKEMFNNQDNMKMWCIFRPAAAVEVVLDCSRHAIGSSNCQYCLSDPPFLYEAFQWFVSEGLADELIHLRTKHMVLLVWRKKDCEKVVIIKKVLWTAMTNIRFILRMKPDAWK